MTDVKIGPGAHVLDLGCGPGLYANPLAALGAHVVGVDFSERSIRHARSAAPAEAPAPIYIHGNYLDVDIPGTFDVVLLAMCDYCALSPPQRRTLRSASTHCCGLMEDSCSMSMGWPRCNAARRQSPTSRG